MLSKKKPGASAQATVTARKSTSANENSAPVKLALVA
jgi:hypothetical protein